MDKVWAVASWPKVASIEFCPKFASIESSCASSTAFKGLSGPMGDRHEPLKGQKSVSLGTGLLVLGGKRGTGLAAWEGQVEVGEQGTPAHQEPREEPNLALINPPSVC